MTATATHARDGGRLVLVTGTSKGIGTAIARRFLDDGDRVIGVSRGGSADAVSAELIDVRADLADLDATAGLVDEFAERHGEIDVLINNAAMNLSGACWELSREDYAAQITMNLTVPFLLSQAVIRRWVDAGRAGSIVNICSIESEVGWPDPPQAVYAATKSGLVGLTRSLALDFGARGIRVNGLAPGAIDTAMTPTDPAILERIPLEGRLGRPEEIAAAAAFLAGPDSSYATGEILYVDGGYRLL